MQIQDYHYDFSLKSSLVEKSRICMVPILRFHIGKSRQVGGYPIRIKRILIIPGEKGFTHRTAPSTLAQMRNKIFI